MPVHLQAPSEGHALGQRLFSHFALRRRQAQANVTEGHVEIWQSQIQGSDFVKEGSQFRQREGIDRRVQCTEFLIQDAAKRVALAGDINRRLQLDGLLAPQREIRLQIGER